MRFLRYLADGVGLALVLTGAAVTGVAVVLTIAGNAVVEAWGSK